MNDPFHPRQFNVTCLEKHHFPELIFGRVYLAEEDEKGKEANYIRVYAESEDYLFPRNWFEEITIPLHLQQRLRESALEEIETEIE